MIDCDPSTCETLAKTAPQLVEAAMPAAVGAVIAVATGVAGTTDKTEVEDG